MVSTPPPKIDHLHNYTNFDHWQLFQNHTWPQFIFLHSKSIIKVSYENLPSSFHTTPCLRVPPPPIDYFHNYSLWLLPTFSTTYLTRIHSLPQHRHCEGLPQKINIQYLYLPCLCVPPPKLIICTMHNYIVFDHCQLFRQHTWPNFIFCHNIGIVKVSHKKINIQYLYLLCLCVPPPTIDYLHNAQLHSLWPLPNFSTAYLAKLHILPQHKHCEGISQEINIHFPYSPCLCACTPSPQMDYLHNYIFFDHCQFFLQLFPQHRYLTRIHILPQYRHCEGLPHKFNIRYPYSSSCLCVPPQKIDYLHNYKVFDHCQLFHNILGPQFIFYHHIGIVKNSHIKILNLLSIPPPCLCVPPPPKKEHLNNYIIYDQCQLFSQHSTSPVQIWDNMGRIKVYQKNLTSLCRSFWVSPKIYYLPNCTITDPCQLYLNILGQFKFGHNVGS